MVPGTVTIDNRFGEQTVRFLESSDRTLCVAAGAQLAGTQPEAAGERQSLRCRRVRSVPRARLEPTPPDVELVDEIETKRMRVRRIESLCTPVALGDEALLDPEATLACYSTSQAPRQPPFRPPGAIELTSEFGAQSVTVRNAQRMLCVPTRLVE